MKKTLALLLALLLVVPMAACGASPAPEATGAPAGLFADVPADADYAGAVAWCYDQGLMKGVSDAAFDPEGTLTRAMLATVLFRAAGAPDLSQGNFGYPFADVAWDSWYTTAVYWARMSGLIQGYGGDRFGPDDPVSVEQLSVILDRYLGKGDTWVGDPARAMPATRVQVAAALYGALKDAPAPAVSEPPAETGKTLVAYFSATGTTKAVAEKLAQATGGDLFEIVPEVPYTKADLNYSASCRANDEQRDDAAMPAIAASCKVEGWESYDVVFLGHPIWWGIPPKVLRTFCQQYDWTGKTVVGFCTSGGSPYSNAGLPERTAGATWKDTRRLNGATQATVEAWVESLELTQKEESEMNKLTVTFNGHTYTATLADNPSVDAFVELLQGGAVTVHAHDFGSFEKVGALGATIVESNRQTDTVPGDIILYQGSNVCLYYATNSWNFTPLGHLEGDLSSLKAHLGDGDVDITYALAK